jgi:hypothetical protein
MFYFNFECENLLSPRINQMGPNNLQCEMYYIDNDIDIDIFVNCNWVDTRWQYTFTHKQYIEHHD